VKGEDVNTAKSRLDSAEGSGGMSRARDDEFGEPIIGAKLT
jgi:hypothetical protein